jgi:ribosomal protein S10
MSLKSDNVELCGIVAAILKMAKARKFSMSGIYSGHHNLPTNEMSLKSDNVEFVRIVAAILKMATSRNFSMSGHHNLPTYEMSFDISYVGRL